MKHLSNVYFAALRFDGLYFGMKFLIFSFSPFCQEIVALSRTQHAIMSEWVTAREANKHNCALSGALNTAGFKVIESVVRVLVTTLAFSTQPRTSRGLSAHYPHICIHRHAHAHTHTRTPSSTGGSILIALYRELMRTFFKYITFTWKTVYVSMWPSVHMCMCMRVCVPLTGAQYLDR